MSRKTHHHRRFWDTGTAMVNQSDSVPTNLGPLDELWDTWTETSEKYKLGADYYYRALQFQLSEAVNHLLYGRVESAKNEIVDVIGLAVDWLRRIGVTKEELPIVIHNRVVLRYMGATDDIVERYVEMFRAEVEGDDEV